MQIEEIKSLLNQPAGEKLAFAPESGKLETLAETLAALANGPGGVLLFGVTGQGRVTGLTDVETALNKAVEAALSCDPPLIIPIPQPLQFDNMSILVVEIPSGLPHVYQAGRHFPIQPGPITSLSRRANCTG